MATALVAAARQVEDPLSYLPCSTTVEVRAGENIFSPGQAASRIFVVVSGYVKVSRETRAGREVVVDIYKSDEFFGESALTHRPRRTDKATALMHTAVMSWDINDVEALMIKRPLLGIALTQLLAMRDADFVERIESLTTDGAGMRIARALLRFGERLGERDDEATVWIPPLTHVVMAETVGASREVVTSHMNDFRRRGFVRYSRRGILLTDGLLREWVRQSGKSASEAAPL